MSKKDEPKKLGKNGVDMGDRGVYDKRNTLNDLTGKEWGVFLPTLCGLLATVLQRKKM